MLSGIKRMVWRDHLIPFLGRRNWRPAACTPLHPDYLRAKNGFDEEELIKQAAARLALHTMASFERLASLWQQVRYLDRYEIPGSFVECGVWRGGCVALMAMSHMHGREEPTRVIHLFDSFQGLPQPDSNFDGAEAIAMAGGKAAGLNVPIDACVASMEECRSLLIDQVGYPSHLVKFHEGWFEDTVPAAAKTIGEVALLRLDGDWYSSTKICLDQFYGEVAPRGVVVIDDYGHFKGCRKAVDEFIAGVGEPILLSHIDYTGRYWIKA